MGDVHIGPGLDRNQRIFRSISFYDLIDLMTFSQLIFSHPHRMRSEAGGFPTRSTQASAERANVMLQSWNMFDDEDAIDWSRCDTSSASIYLVSSIQALSNALFPARGIDVSIERTCRVVHIPGRSKAARLKAVPLYEDETLSVIVNGTGEVSPAGQRAATVRLLVDLKALLIGVIVSPAASIRHVELVSQTVQRATHAFVSRASQPMAIDAVAAFGVRRA